MYGCYDFELNVVILKFLNMSSVIANTHFICVCDSFILQYEVAPSFQDSVIASDNNMLMQMVFEKVTRRHNVKVIFHEKPFQGINGYLNSPLFAVSCVPLFDLFFLRFR